jgi:acyl carrier protein
MARMKASSAPEGDELCPICGRLGTTESSVGREDALCESCSHLLWHLRNRFGDLGVDVKLGDSIRFGSDSLDLAELMMVLGIEFEEDFGVEIPESEIEQCVTIDDLIRLIQRYRRSKGG